MSMELRQLRAFLTVAAELHFSRAAQRLHVSQSALSQQIRALENNLGAPLFSRTSRLVELTTAGEALLEAAPRVLFEADRAVQRVQQAAEGTAGVLAIGSVSTALASVAPQIMRSMRAEFPNLRLELTQMDTSAQLVALTDHRLDVALVREASPRESLCVEQLVSEPLLTALPSDHPLAELETVRPEDLADEPFVLWPRSLGADFFDVIISYCREHGFSPRIVAEGNDVETQLGLVASGVGVSLQPPFYSNLRMVGVAFRPLVGSAPRIALQVAWRRNDPSPAVRHFVTAALRVANDGS